MEQSASLTQKNRKRKKKKLILIYPYLKKQQALRLIKKEMIKIINDLGFNIKKNKKFLDLEIPSWRPDISQPIDVVEEVVRIKGYEHIETIEPEKSRLQRNIK